MESKPKKRQVRKARSGTPAQQKSDPPLKPTSPEALIRFNGELVEELFSSTPWKEIAFPLLEESIASVSGRFTNGRFYQGTLTKTKHNRDELAGYQLALEEFYNRLKDFIDTKDKMIEERKRKEEEKDAPFYNPMTEEEYETEQSD